MPSIRQLPPSVVNKIAAGEVIERPASVVKELVENAVDAGAARIDVAIEQGGIDLVRVVDDGGGIAPEELALAVASHATSKIAGADDLFRVGTLGFRGEALASIAEVSRLALCSRTRGHDAGAELEVVGGHYQAVVPCGAPVGTRAEVRQLFYNTPVRRKFLKSTQTEAGHVSEAFTRIALAYPRIHFTLRHNDRTVYDLPPVKSVLPRIAELFGGELADALIWVESRDEQVRLSGYVANPSHSRANNRMQYLFLNGRHIRDRSLQHAMSEAYRGLLLTGRYPVALLSLEMPPEMVDVNVHPTKLEVRFQDGGRLYSQLLGTLRTRFLTADLTARGVAARGHDSDFGGHGVGGHDDVEGGARLGRDDDRRQALPADVRFGTLTNSWTSPSRFPQVGGGHDSAVGGQRILGVEYRPASDAAPYDEPAIERQLELVQWARGKMDQARAELAENGDCSAAGASPHVAPFAPFASDEPRRPLDVVQLDRSWPDVEIPADDEDERFDDVIDAAIEEAADAALASDARAASDADFVGRADSGSRDNRFARFDRPWPTALQIHNRYLVAESDEGVVVIDQHALHERILYEQLRAKVLDGALESQNLLVPEPVDLAPAEAAAVLDRAEELERLGIRVAPFGGDTVLVSSYPAMLANMSPAEVLRDIVEQLLVEGKSPQPRDLVDELLHSFSCKAAIKAGDRLTPEEVDALLAQRHLAQDAHHCPHGRPTALVFTRAELDRQFKRT